MEETEHPLRIATKGKKQLEVFVVHNHCIMKHDEDDIRPETHRDVALVGSRHIASVVKCPLVSDANKCRGKQQPWNFINK